MQFITRTLGEICDEVGGTIRTGPFGSQLHESDYMRDGTPVVMPKNIIDGKVSVEDIALIGEVDVARLSQHKLRKGDIVYGRRGDIGRRALITEKEEGWICGTGCLRISLGNTVLAPKFLYYYLGQPDVIAWIFNQAIGATMPNLNTAIIRSISIFHPPLPTQRKIAAILSAYDDLIENNTRRIAIMEEMAQALYREWFVHFRFPGHEKKRIGESALGMIPEGWEIVKVENIIQRVPTGKQYDNKTVAAFGLIPVLDQGKSGIIGYHDNEPGVFASEDAPIIVFANHTCYQRIIQFPFSTIQNVLPFLPNTECNRNIYWLHWATKDLVKFNDYKGHWPEFVGKKLLLPPVKLCSLFGTKVEALVQQAYIFEQQNTNLRHTRDLLLPKLISGEVDVERLHIETGEATSAAAASIEDDIEKSAEAALAGEQMMLWG